MSEKKQSRFDLVIGAVDRFGGVFKGFNDRVDRAKAKLDRLKSSTNSLGRATGLAQLADAGKNLGSSFGKVHEEGKKLLGLAGKLMAGFSLLFGAAGGGFLALAKNTAAAGDEAVKGAQRAGVGVKTWQEYAYAASLADVSNEQLQKGFVKLQDVGLKAARGDKAQRSLLRSIGIDPKTAKGEIKNADTLFMEVAGKIKALQDAGQGGKAVNLAKEIFGKQGAELMPLLLAGKDGLKDLRLEAHKLGIVLSEEDGKASEEFNDSFSRMGAAFKGWGFTIGKLVLPHVTKLVTKITDWAAANREVIAGKLEKWLAKLDIDKLWQSFENGLSTLGDLAKKADDLAQRFGGWENVMMAVAAFMSRDFVFSFGDVAWAIGKFGAALLATPVGWFLGACALIAGGIYIIYDKWDDICAYFKGLWKEVTDAFDEGIIKGIATLLTNFNPLNLLMDAVNGLVKYLFGIDMLAIAARWAKDLMHGFAKLLPDKVRNFIGLGEDKFKSGPEVGGNRYMTGKPRDQGGREARSERETNNRQRDSATSGAREIGGSQRGGAAMGQALNMGGIMRTISETRTTHVEKQEMTMRISLAEGLAGNVVKAANNPDFKLSQNGQLMGAGA